MDHTSELIMWPELLPSLPKSVIQHGASKAVAAHMVKGCTYRSTGIRAAKQLLQACIRMAVQEMLTRWSGHLRLLAHARAPQRGDLALAPPPPVGKLLGRLRHLPRQRHLPQKRGSQANEWHEKGCVIYQNSYEPAQRYTEPDAWRGAWQDS